MGGKTVERDFKYPAPVIFEAARRSIASLGYTIVHSDSTGHTLSFNTGRSMSSWAGQDLTATIFDNGDSTRVVVGGSLATRGNPFGGGSQIASWGEKKKLSLRFLDEIPSHIVIPSSPAPSAKSSSVETESDAGPIELLQRLGELRDSGVITSEQFEAKRAEILKRI